MVTAIEVRYRCHCMDAEVTVRVRARTEGEDIIDWMRMVQVNVGADHSFRSPRCTATNMIYLKVPAPENAPFIGGKPITN